MGMREEWIYQPQNRSTLVHVQKSPGHVSHVYPMQCHCMNGWGGFLHSRKFIHKVGLALDGRWRNVQRFSKVGNFHIPEYIYL